MDNYHQIILLSLIAFGMGHILIKAKFGLIMLSLLGLFVFFIYTQFSNTDTKLIAVGAFIAGIAYAYKAGDFARPRWYGKLWLAWYFLPKLIPFWWMKFRDTFSGIFPKKPSPNVSQDQNTNQTEQQEQAWKQEQQRRQEEARQQRKSAQQDTSNKKQQSSSQNKQSSNQQKQSQQDTFEHHNYQHDFTQPEPSEKIRSYMEILGLKVGFTQEELKTAYRRKSSKFHPDKWATKSEDFIKAKEEEQKLVNRAYEQLKH